LHTYKQVSKYNVELITINLNGCKDTIIKKLDLNAYLLVPNTITPNNDGKGDKFEIVSKGVVKLSNFKIYNRWGELVFDGGSDLKSSWDGTFNGAEQGMGVFVYYVSGTTIYGEEIKLSGNLTLVR
jgi:gliding motility-associated-like protein